MGICTNKVLFENNDFRITLRDTGSNMLVVAFSPMYWPERGKKDRYWGDVVARKLPFSWLSIDAMAEHWFCDTKWRQIVEMVHEVTQRFAVRIGYGHSMGAYAALKRSRDYMPRAILAFAPQCSIHPDDVGSFDVRYVREFDPQIHQGMKLQATDIRARAFIFFDAQFDTDRKHVMQISGANVARISVGYMRHDVIFVAKGSVSLSYLFMCAFLEEPHGAHEMHRYLRVQKKTNHIYLTHLAYKALKNGHAQWAFDVATRALQLDTTYTRVALVQLQACMQLNLKESARATIDSLNTTALSDGDAAVVARVMVNLGLGERALQIMERPSIIEGTDTKCMRALADLQLTQGTLNRAVALLERAVTLAPNDPHCLAHLAKVLMKDRSSSEYDLPRAVALLKRAIEIGPNVAGFWKSYAFALEASGDSHAAVLAWSWVDKMAGLGQKDRIRFELLQLKVSRDSAVNLTLKDNEVSI